MHQSPAHILQYRHVYCIQYAFLHFQLFILNGLLCTFIIISIAVDKYFVIGTTVKVGNFTKHLLVISKNMCSI